MLVLVSCAPKTAPSSTEEAITDSFFSGYALLDANGNGQVDEEDTPVEGATFIVALQGGGEFGDVTGKNGMAFVIIPSSVDYPVTLRMEAPKDGGLKLLGPSAVTFSAGDESPTFLFQSETK